MQFLRAILKAKCQRYSKRCKSVGTWHIPSSPGMNIIFLLSGLLIGLATGRMLWHKKGANLGAANAALQARKEAEKAKVLQLFSSKPEITNNDVEKLLGVSNATATNYLTELEAEGKLVQLGGEDGRSVRYRLNA